MANDDFGDEDLALLANGMLNGMFEAAHEHTAGTAASLIKWEPLVDEDGMRTNEHYIWFPIFNSRFKLTIVVDNP